MGGGWEVMKNIKRALDPEERHESWQAAARPGDEDELTLWTGFPLQAEYVRPTARRISDGVIMRIDHVYEAQLLAPTCSLTVLPQRSSMPRCGTPSASSASSG